MTEPAAEVAPQKVVFADANVLYARVLRDYLLYSAAEDIINVVWSRAVLDEMAEHLVKNLLGFDWDAAERLIASMTKFYPDAEINPTAADYKLLADYSLPDEGDRHIFAAAVAAEADIICTSNKKDFPEDVASRFYLEVLSPDELLSRTIKLYPERMLVVHSEVIKYLPNATDASTLAALQKAGAIATCKLLRALLSLK
jgi:predicted nucleic acid-binding protein